MNLEEIKRAFHNGDNSPLTFMFEEHAKYCVSNLCKRNGCSSDVAQDIFLESMINFREKVLANRVDFLTSLRNYLYTTCINMHSNLRKAEQRLNNNEEDIKFYFYQTLEEEVISLDWENDTQKQLVQTCLDTLEELGKKCRVLLRYVYVQEMTLSEIIKQMDFSNMNVMKASKSRCLKQWKEKIYAKLKK